MTLEGLNAVSADHELEWKKLRIRLYIYYEPFSTTPTPPPSEGAVMLWPILVVGIQVFVGAACLTFVQPQTLRQWPRAWKHTPFLMERASPRPRF